jgi:hypothetical protein
MIITGTVTMTVIFARKEEEMDEAMKTGAMNTVIMKIEVMDMKAGEGIKVSVKFPHFLLNFLLVLRKFPPDEETFFPVILLLPACCL